MKNIENADFCGEYGLQVSNEVAEYLSWKEALEKAEQDEEIEITEEIL